MGCAEPVCTPASHSFHTAQVTAVIMWRSKLKKLKKRFQWFTDKSLSERIKGDNCNLYYMSQELTWFEKVCQWVTSHHRLLSTCVMLSLIMQKCLDRSVQCYFSTHYSMLQLNPSNQRWFYCLLDKQVSVYSKGRVFSTAAISPFTEQDSKMKCFFSADWKGQSQYFPWGCQESSAPGGCLIMVLQTDYKACMSMCVHACVPTHTGQILLLSFQYTCWTKWVFREWFFYTFCKFQRWASWNTHLLSPLCYLKC